MPVTHLAAGGFSRQEPVYGKAQGFRPLSHCLEPDPGGRGYPYLEWGNNDWNAEYPPVRSKSDVAIYFVVDSWENPPVLRLVRRNSENAEDLFSMPLEGDLLADWRKANGDWRGVGAPTPKIREWLKKELGQEGFNS